MSHFEDVACLPECDERHADECPREAAEMGYWRVYFAVGTDAFWNFAPVGHKTKADAEGGN